MSEWIDTARDSLGAARDYGEAVRAAVLRAVAPDGAPQPALMAREQHGPMRRGSLARPKN
jgi:hypothetical protein